MDYKIKYLHIMKNEKFIKSYINFINNDFDQNEHLFLIIDGIDEKKIELPIFDNVIRYKSSIVKNKLKKKIYNRIDLKLYRFLKSYLSNSERVYFHSFFDQRWLMFLYIHRKYLKISNWIIWGGDLYCYEKRENKILNKIFYKIEDYVKGNIAYINTLVPGDYKIAKKYFKVKGIYKQAMYLNPINIKNLNLNLNNKKSEIYVQIGNSADMSNNHKEILDILYRFKDKNLKVFCILSYGGNDSYILDIKNYGYKLFGNKFVPIINFMTPKQYSNYLKDIDILIFNHKRQQGISNIFALAYMEKKIYIRSDISSWEFLTENIGLKIYDTLKIKEENYQEFITQKENNNRKIAKETKFSEKFAKKIWYKNFNFQTF